MKKGRCWNLEWLVLCLQILGTLLSCKFCLTFSFQYSSQRSKLQYLTVLFFRELSTNALRGTLPQSMSNLTKLRHLFLFLFSFFPFPFYSLSFPFPFLFPFFSFLSLPFLFSCVILLRNLASNKFEGTLPNMKGWIYLEKLYIFFFF